MADNERKRRNGIEGKGKTKTLKELEAENADLKVQVKEAQDALVELAEIIAEGM